MKVARYWPLALAVALALAWPAYALLLNEPSAQSEMKVRWLLSHKPSEVFERAADVFAEELSERSEGRLTLEIVMPEDIGWKKGDVPNDEVLRRLASGDVQLASLYTVPLGKKEPAFWTLGLPFLVDTYEEAEGLLESKTADTILGSLEKDTGLRALAFTMSGGFRIIASKDMNVETLADLAGKRIATSGGPVAEATLRALGAVPVPTDLESGKRITGTIDGVETAYSRLSAVVGEGSALTSHINETNHNIFLTVIAASASFYESLSPSDQEVLVNAARVAARAERADSKAFAANVRKKLEDAGSTISVLSPEARASLQEATADVYDLETLPRDIVEALLR